MEPEKVLEVIGLYRKRFEELHIPKVDYPHDELLESPEQGLAHCHGMLDKMEKFLAQGQWDKVQRWLGFIQCQWWNAQVFVLDELKNHSKPN